MQSAAKAWVDIFERDTLTDLMRRFKIFLFQKFLDFLQQSSFATVKYSQLLQPESKVHRGTLLQTAWESPSNFCSWRRRRKWRECRQSREQKVEPDKFELLPNASHFSILIGEKIDHNCTLHTGQPVYKHKIIINLHWEHLIILIWR